MSDQSASSSPSSRRGGSGARGSSTPPPAETEAPAETPDAGTPEPETHDAAGKPTPAPAEAAPVASGELIRYRAIVGMGEGESKVKAGQKFYATPDDPRVRSGYAVKLKDTTPPAVADAFAATEGSTDAVGGPPS